MNDSGTAYDVVGIDIQTVTKIVISNICKNLPVTGIGSRAFKDCSSLTNVTILSPVARIGFQVFEDCSLLQYNEYENAYYLGNDTNPYLALIKVKDAFIPSCTIHKNTKIIAESAFDDCSSLTSVTIPDGVTNIGRQLFDGCSSLTSIIFNGTKTQWKAIEKSDDWNYVTGDFTVQCTDGKLDKNGNEIA